MTEHQPTTHERYLHAVRDVVIARALDRRTITAEHGERLSHTKLLYGVGDGSYRGVTVFDAWENGVGRVDIVEVAATGQESWIQLAGTLIHDPLTALTGRFGGVMGRRCADDAPVMVVLSGFLLVRVLCSSHTAEREAAWTSRTRLRRGR